MTRSLHEELGGAVHVWVADPCRFANRVVMQQFHCWLSHDEHRRYRSFHFARDRHTYLVAHGVLRHLISRYSYHPPAALRFETGPHGRLEVASPRFSFNISHTRGLIAWAFSLDGSCGVDVEEVREDVDMDVLMPAVCSREERELLAQLPGTERSVHFFQLWSLKEAVLKACGIGVGDGIASLTVREAKDGGYRVDDELCRVPNQTAWYLHGTMYGNSHVLAVAYERRGGCRQAMVLKHLDADDFLVDNLAATDDGPRLDQFPMWRRR